VKSSDDSHCYAVDWQPNSDCGEMMEDYPKLLNAQTAFCVLCTLLPFILSIICCVSLCSESTYQPQQQNPEQPQSVGVEIPVVALHDDNARPAVVVTAYVVDSDGAVK
jgi:hypothetical protein